MKWLHIILLCLVVQNASAQFDTLLNRNFNDRYPALLALSEQNPHSAGLQNSHTKLDAIAVFARTHRDFKLLAEIESVEFKQFCKNTSNSQKAIDSAFDKTAQTAQKAQHAQLLVLLDCYLSDYEWAIQNYPAAILHLESALENAQKLTESQFYFKQELTYQLASRYYFLTDYASAIHHLEKAAKMHNPNAPNNPNISIFNTLGLAYQNRGNLKAAEHYFKQALEYAQLKNDQAWIGNLSGNLGHLYIIQGDLDKGELLLQTDKNLSLNNGAKGPAAGAMLELANLYFKKQQPEKSIQLVDSARLLLNGRMPFNRKKLLYPLLSKINGYQGNWQLAAMYLDSSLLVMDSVARLDNAVQMLRLKQQVELQASRVEIAEREAGIRKKTMQVYAMIALLLLAFIASLLVLRQKKHADNAKKRSDELLLNILPHDVAEELKQSGTSKARKFHNTSVLFCDFINFTNYSEQLDPEELVRILDDYFKAFDQIVAGCGLEKIKTVGDAYICAGGLPIPDPSHAEKVVRCALQIQEIMKTSSAGWQLRIGIHSGPVVAGIVGIKKFAYDIWGDTVNTAARMEQNAEAGKVNISQATYDLVKEQFHCIHRGKVTAKHKGELDMYYVEG